MPTTHPDDRDERKDTGRIEAFSDGVFAIAVTLLVLDLHVPRAGDTGLKDALLKQWPSYLAYAISFVTILVMWVNHHNMFRFIARTDHTFLLINGLLLMAVTVVPFPTALLAEYIQHQEAGIAAAVFNGTYVVLALVFNLLWRYAAFQGRLLVRNADREFVRKLSRGYLFGPLLYGVAFALGLVSVPASLAIQVGLTIYFALPFATTREAGETDVPYPS